MGLGQKGHRQQWEGRHLFQMAKNQRSEKESSEEKLPERREKGREQEHSPLGRRWCFPLQNKT